VKALAGASAIGIGANHTCALSGATMSCWGRNDSGQLGNSTKADTSVPSKVSLTVVTSFATGAYHTCSIGSSGDVACWGSGSLGKLGNGSTTDSEFPYGVTGLGSGAVAVTAGMSHTCALVAGGRALCWGEDTSNELGDGGGSARTTPVSVNGLSGATSISAGGSKTCALLAGGTVACWGFNGYGEMGNGTGTPSTSGVVTVPGLSAVAAISSGDGYACALLSNGTVSCWGSNGKGMLGLGTASGALSPPTTVPNLTGVVAVAAGSQHTCALLSAGNVKCWGWNYYGQLGTGNTTDSPSPVDVKW
jgi:alpha-tubulin suppressor-like RCC1 family protein